MKKIWVIFILVMCASLVKSQDSTDFTLNNITAYAAHIEKSSSFISSNIKENKQQTLIEQAENIKAYIDSIEEEMQYLPDEYYYRLSSLVSSCHTDIDEFEKLVLNNDFPDKDKFLTKAFASLQQRQTEFRKALATTYRAALQQQPGAENRWNDEVMQQDSGLIDEHESTSNNAAPANSSDAVLVEAVDPTAITTTNNALLLDSIHQSVEKVEQWIAGIQMAKRNNNFSTIAAKATSIAKAALKISDFTLLLKTDQKQNLFILATGLKNLSETLYNLARKGITAQDKIQECIDKMEIKFNTLSTGIGLVQ